jgi:cytochrome o ubiquinol oxidase subunit II
MIPVKMNKKLKLPLFILLCLGVVALAAVYISTLHIDILSPQGVIAHKQRNLIAFAAALSLIVVVPVFCMTFWFSWKYNVKNRSRKKAAYRPDWDNSRVAETVWWLVPAILILILSVVTYRSAHDLDPYKPISTNTKPLTVQVVALEWKWLFIYPDRNIATVNYLEIPEDTPVNFQLTSDAPMNSFWIPRLGGQVFAMSGMSTQLHLMADHTGDYTGGSANLSGEGFAGMKFTTHVSTPSDFGKWVQGVQGSAPKLTNDLYSHIVKPSKDNPPEYYGDVQSGLYDTIVMKYMMPGMQAGAEGVHEQ